MALAFFTLVVPSWATAQCTPAWQLGPNTEGVPGVQGNVLVRAIAELPDGRLVAAGAFTGAGGRPALHVAIWDGDEWHPLGSGLGGPGSAVFALESMPDGSIIAGGTFQTEGGATNLARWNGSLWVPLSGLSPNESVTALHVTPNGLLVIGGDFNYIGGVGAHRIATWDGTSFQSLGTGLGSGGVKAIRSLPNGGIVVAGGFTSPCSFLAVWNSNAWSCLGPPLAVAPGALTVTSVGEVVVSGTFQGTVPGELSSFAILQNGVWLPLGRRDDTDAVFGLAFDASLGLVAGANSNLEGFASGETVVRWANGRWEPIGPPMNGSAYTVLALRGGGFAVGGNFTQIGNPIQGSGGFANGIARYGARALPRLTVEPGSQSLVSGDAVTYVATTSDREAMYRWEIERTPGTNDWIAVGDDPLILPCGVATVTGWNTLAMTIRVVNCAEGAAYRVRIAGSACGDAHSLPASLTIRGACAADVDDGHGLGVPDGGVTIDDLLYFLTRFEAGC